MPDRRTAHPLPAYRFVPGRSPHPRHDRAAHGMPELAVASCWRAEDWRGLDAYLYGLDLFERGFFWEAHEAWEAVWRQATDPSDERSFVQGLIQLAAACLKIQVGNHDAARRLAESGARRLEAVGTRHARFMGLDPSELARGVRLKIVDTTGDLDGATIELAAGT